MATRSNLSPGAGWPDEARLPSGASKTKADVDTLGTIAMFCGAGLVVALLLIVALLLATYGLDLSIGFF